VQCCGATQILPILGFGKIHGNCGKSMEFLDKSVENLDKSMENLEKSMDFLTNPWKNEDVDGKLHGKSIAMFESRRGTGV
jgi:5-methylcytosine-specific restriction endonuclease McrBC regulatory subunit McrC